MKQHSFIHPLLTFRTLIIASTLFLFFLRFNNLGADPLPFLSPWVAGDEGYWVHHARIWTLGLHLDGDQFKEDLVVAPLYVALQYPVFKALGVNYTTTRILPAALSLLGLFLFYRFLRKFRDEKISLLLTVFLGIHPLFLAMNRVALPDVAAFPLLMIALIGWERRQAITTGLSLIALFLMKTTNIFLFPTFLSLAMSDWPSLQNRQFLKRVINILVIGIACAGLVVWKYQQEFSFAYMESSGLDFLPQKLGNLFGIFWLAVFNPFWSRPTILPLSLLALPGLFSRDRLFRIGQSLVVWGSLFFMLTPNQGVDHRFWHVIVGMVLLIGAKSKQTLGWLFPSLVLIMSARGAIPQLTMIYNLWVSPEVIRWALIMLETIGLWTIFPLFGRGYFFLCGTLIIFIFVTMFAVLTPTRTLSEVSRIISLNAGKNAVITGIFAHELAIPTNLYPVYYWSDRSGRYEVNGQFINTMGSAGISLTVLSQENANQYHCRFFLFSGFLDSNPKVKLGAKPDELCQKMNK